MTIDINELRRLAQAAMHPVTKGRWMRLFGERTVYDRMEDGCRGIPVVSTDKHPPSSFEAACLDFIAAANPAVVIEILDRLEAAEKERDKLKELNIALCTKSNSQVIHNARLAEENDTLHAKIEAMERQKPAGKFIQHPSNGLWEQDGYGDNPDARPLYALPGAQTQPSSSVPDGWLRAIDEALVVANVGVANEIDTYEQAKAKLDSLLGFHVDAATDPAVNGGWKLVPRPPTPTMVKAGLKSSHVLNVHRVLACYDAMLDAAPEAKP